jgi:TPR repeat protein
VSNLTDGLNAFHDKDYALAMTLLMAIAEAGNPEAQCVIANLYHLGLGVEVNMDTAIEWYRKSSEQGYGVASNNLGGIFLAGHGGGSPDREEAEQWYQKARDQGFKHTPNC